MNGGIDQLVDTYKGNPQPLQSKVQKAQQSQPPGEVPPDLEEAIALQKIAELRNSAQGQQAMQAGGAQQSVVEKLRQMLGNMQQQNPMQGQPVMAASGGSIDQLMSNLGQYYAGGGIVAFDDGGRGKDKKPLEQYTLQQQGADYVARKQAERLANAQEESSSPSQFVRDVAEIPGAFDAMKQRAREEDAARAAQDARMAKYKQEKLGAQQKTSLFNYFFGSPEREKEGLTKLAALSNAPLDKEPTVQSSKPGTTYERPGNIAAPTVNNMYTDKDGKTFVRPAGMSDESWKKLVADARTEQTPTSQGAGDRIVPRYPISTPSPSANKSAANTPAAPRPTVVNPGIAGGPAKPAVEPTNPLETALQKSIMDALAKDPEEVRRRAIEANKQAMGLDALLKPAQDRAASRETMIKQIQAGRQPLWITALQNAGRKPGNVAQVLDLMASGVSAAKQGYDTQDLKFLDELSDLYAGIDKAKIEGRYKDVAAGQAAVKDLIAEQRSAEQSGTSLLNTKENVRSREQIARDAAAGRAQTAAMQAQNVALAREERIRQFNESELRKIREKDVDRAAKIETAIAKRTAMIDMQLQNPKLKPEEETALLTRRNTIVKQVQAEYPSIKPEKPSESQFLAAARAANPGVSDADLKAYYKQNYGS